MLSLGDNSEFVGGVVIGSLREASVYDAYAYLGSSIIHVTL